MKIAKKALALLLAALLCGGLAAPSFAEPDAAEEAAAQGSPVVEKPKKAVTSATGKTATLEVRATAPEGALGPLSYQWYESIADENGQWQDRLIEGATEPKLTVAVTADELLSKMEYNGARSFKVKLSYVYDESGNAAAFYTRVPLLIYASLPDCYRVLNKKCDAARSAYQPDWVFLLLGAPFAYVFMPLYYLLAVAAMQVTARMLEY
ncbi:MAG: hypothetical protein LBG83_06155 [Oscillospiraceae bacterium]|jgi:hypothetical protein|nr:hypothetical protein [Oscillospiraceae bacterium]